MAWTCPHCGWITGGNQGVITQHLSGCNENPNASLIECDFCDDKGFESKNRLDQHESHCPYNPENNTFSGSDLKCSYCGDRLSSSQIKEGNTYCGRSCSNAAVPRRDKKDKEKHLSCVFCESDFAPKNKGQKYCSMECFHEQRRNRIDKEIEEDIRESPTRRTLRGYLIRKRGRSCSICGKESWEGEKIPIELDHIDGDHTNNDLDNLRLVCPNCHAQTDTYKGANLGNGRSYRKKYYN